MLIYLYMIVRGKAPVRISFGSAGDSDYYFDIIDKGNGVNATINLYSYCEIHPRKDDKIVLRSLETGHVLEFNSLDEINFGDRALNLMKATVKHYNNTGIEVITYTDAPLDSGLGGSAAHTVSMIEAFNEFNKIRMTKEEIARLAHKLERVDLGIGGGRQDQWAAAFGGFNFLEFTKNGVNLTALPLSDRDLERLENSLLLVHVPRETSGRDVHLEQRSKSPEVLSLLSMKMNNVELLREALSKRNFDEIGKILHLDWKIKKQLASSISNQFVDKIYDTALRAGATGGRLIGAGSGGSALFYCGDRKHDVAKALEALGLMEIKFRFERVERRTENYAERILNQIKEHHNVIGDVISNEDLIRKCEAVTHKIVESYKNNGKLIIFGNGGSAADAQHIAGELVNKFKIDRPMLNALALTVNTSVLTAVANDYCYEDVFSKQVERLAEHNDIVIGISTSGKAENVRRGLIKAKERGAFVVYMTGKTGGKISETCNGTIDISLNIPSTNTPRVQEAHITLGHIICELVEHELYGK